MLRKKKLKNPLLDLNISRKLVAKLQNQCEVSVEDVTLFISGIWRGK